MAHDLINGLISDLYREINPDENALKEILILSGMPEKKENLRYLGFNRQIIESDSRVIEFSAVAVINNHRAHQWRLEGYHRKLSQLIFDRRWASNPLDIFINKLRCSPEMMNLLATAGGACTLLGMLKYQVIQVAGVQSRCVHHVRPILAVSGIDSVGLQTVVAFETANEIRKTKIKGLPFYRRVT